MTEDLKKTQAIPDVPGQLILEECAKTGYLVIPHEQFQARAMSLDCAGYFVDGFGLLEIIGNCSEGIVLQGIDHCNDMLQGIEFTQAHHVHLESKCENYLEIYGKLEVEIDKLEATNEALRKLQTDEAIKNRRLEKEIRDLQATLDQSAEHGGTWPV